MIAYAPRKFVIAQKQGFKKQPTTVIWAATLFLNCLQPQLGPRLSACYDINKHDKIAT